MAYSKIEGLTLKIAEDAAAVHGYGIYDVVYVKEGPHWFLRIYIDRAEGVSLDDCEAISKVIGDRLDADDFIKENYFLEVSSPGLERALRQDWHFDGAVGERVRARLKNGGEYAGVLSAHSGGSVTIDGNVLQKSGIAKANIIFDFA
ncbi:MAG: ribosome maturation factor RimP [Clostridiales bacterium]|nr:ribosome maturation factor RimP [Clostridiales bacterium]